MGYDAPRPFVPGFWVPAPVSGYGGRPRGKGGLIGVLCFSLGSRLRGKDGGGCLNRRLRRFSQMGYDAPRPFVPGFWVPAPVSGYGGRPRGKGGLIGVLCFSLGSRLRGNDGGVRGSDGGGARERGLIGVFSLAIGDRGVGDTGGF